MKEQAVQICAGKMVPANVKRSCSVVCYLIKDQGSHCGWRRVSRGKWGEVLRSQRREQGAIMRCLVGFVLSRLGNHMMISSGTIPSLYRLFPGWKINCRKTEVDIGVY